MNKTLRILLLSVLITVLAAACGQSGIRLEEETGEAVMVAAGEAATDTDPADDAGEIAAEDAATVAAQADPEQAVQETTPSTVCVYVCGEVVTPGVYELAEGARIYEALTLAGGLTADADITVVNQAQALTDGMMIRIPAIGESAEAGPVLSQEGESATGIDAAQDAGLVNINTADAATLQTLPGIGETKAAAIVTYREQNGSYKGKEELMNVSGIGESTYRNLESQITVGP